MHVAFVALDLAAHLADPTMVGPVSTRFSGLALKLRHRGALSKQSALPATMRRAESIWPHTTESQMKFAVSLAMRDHWSISYR
jgi:hypothetical protein